MAPPGRVQKFDAGIDGQNFLKQQNQVGAGMRETAKLKLVGVRIGLVNANIVAGKNLKIQIGGTEADAQVADSQMGAGGGKELPQQILAAASRHAVQHVSAAAGQTAAEVIDNLLERFSGQFTVFLISYWDESLFVGFTRTCCGRLSAARAHHRGGGRPVQRLGFLCRSKLCPPL